MNSFSVAENVGAAAAPPQNSASGANWLSRRVRTASPAEDYNGLIMTTRNLGSPSVSEMCAQVKHLGYATSGLIRLYGEEFEVLSDPFPGADGIAVRVKTKKNSMIRVLQLPATVLQSLKRRAIKAA
jgi:hypothetical protein